MDFERREAARAIRESYGSLISAEKGEGLKIMFLALTVDMGIFQGDSTHVNELVSNLRHSGHQVRLIARKSGTRLEYPDPLFHCVSRSPKPASEVMRMVQLLLSMMRGAYYIFRYARGSNVIYSRDRFSLLLAWLPSRLLRRRIVYEVNGITSEQRRMHGKYPLNLLYVWLLVFLDWFAFMSAFSVVCVTDAIRDFYRKRHYKRAAKFVTVNNGVNPKLFHPLPIDKEVAELRSRLGFDETDEVIAYVGNMSLWQGVEYLVKSAPMVIERNPSVRFMIVGQGPAYSACLKLAKKIGVGDKFKFVGQVAYTSLGYYINVADVCVAPYTTNIPNCPIKVYEYLACGKPVVCSDIPGIDNLRADGLLVLVEPCNSEALASALLDVLEDMDARAAQRKLAPRMIAEYTWANTAMKVAELCEAAASRRKKSPVKGE